VNEGLDHWPFVLAAYAIGLGGTLAMIVWAWGSMRRLERRRDEIRRDGASRGAP